MTKAQESLRIAHVDAERGFSGGEVQVLLLMEELRRLGHSSVLIAPPGAVVVERVRARGFGALEAPMRGDLDLTAVLGISRAYRASEADIAHLHTGRATWLGGLAAGRTGIPAVTTRRMERRVKRGWRTRLIYGRLVQGVAAISDGVVSCLADGGVDTSRVVRIPDAVDPRRIESDRSRDAVRAELGLEADAYVVLALGALARRKGIDVLIEALVDVPESRLVVVGDGPERAGLEALASERGIAARVRFLGSRDDVGELLAACDVLAMPSRAEGMGVAALEAMAAGRPVVASRTGGLAETVVDGRTGLLVEPENARELSQALIRLQRDSALRLELGAAGPGRVEEGFTAASMAEAYVDLYRRVLRGT